MQKILSFARGFSGSFMLLFLIDTDVCIGVCQPSHYSVEKDERKEHKILSHVGKNILFLLRDLIF